MRKMLAMGLACMIVLAPAASVSAAELPPATCHIGGCNLGDCFRDLDCDGTAVSSRNRECPDRAHARTDSAD